MRNKIIAGLMFTLFLLSTAGITFASSTDGPDGNKRKGKYTYRKVYKACSETGEVSSATPSVSPADKKMAEWKAIFEAKEFSAFGCQEHWATLSDGDITDIYSYFYYSAADSPSPATCK